MCVFFLSIWSSLDSRAGQPRRRSELQESSPTANSLAAVTSHYVNGTYWCFLNENTKPPQRLKTHTNTETTCFFVNDEKRVAHPAHFGLVPLQDL